MLDVIIRKMKRPIRQKLFHGLAMMLLIVAMVAGGGLVCIKILNRTSNEIVVEYHELDAIQKLKLSFNQTVSPAYDYLLYGQENDYFKFKNKFEEINGYLENCKSIITDSHNKALLEDFEKLISRFDHVIKNYKKTNYDISINRKLIDLLEALLEKADGNVDILLQETQKEIDEYIQINKVAAFHSAITIVTLTVILIVVFLMWGLRFTKKITNPIRGLVDSIQKVAEADFTSKTEIETDDEIGLLADSFNMMIQRLNETSISRNYFNNVLRNILDLLIVTDNKGYITLINNATSELLGYKMDELLDKHVNIVFQENHGDCYDIDFNALSDSIQKKNVEIYYRSKEGKEIPVMFSCSVLKDDKDEVIGSIFVARDISERKMIENELEMERKKHVNDIYETQEKERLRIATEIHDGLGHMLTGISYFIDNYFSNRVDNDSEHQKLIEKLQNQLNDALKESKNIAYDLVPILLKDFGLIVAIENLISQINSKNNLSINFNVFNYLNRIDEKIEKLLFRVIQEAITNIIKHSGAKKVNIQIVKHEKSITLQIEDDGKGFELNKKVNVNNSNPMGLLSMKERVAAYDGVLTIDSELNRGTEILIEIPCTN